jgi:hypothetical protein
MKKSPAPRWTASSSLSGKNERIVILLLCAMAAVRVFLFCAAFPFFNNVDERRHFDLVMKYASGHLPHGTELISRVSLPYLARYASPEFLAAPQDLVGGYYGPSWTRPAEEIAPTMAAIEEIWGRTPNQECSQPPLYYAIAAIWFHVGHLLGLKNGSALYWIRLLNVPLIVELVWLANGAARTVFPTQIAMRLSVSLLIACIPQDAFYGIENDVLSPICFGITFVCLVRWFREGGDAPLPRELSGVGAARRHYPSIILGVATGASIAAAYLTKLSNLPFILVTVVAIAYWCAWQIRTRKIREAIPALGALVVCAAVPIAAWMLWIKSNFGDFTGTASKAQLLGWSAKPFWEWWSHPIFTPSGFWTFLSELIASFWRGELMWHRHVIGWRGMDIFYVFSSLGFFLTAVASLSRSAIKKNTGLAERSALWIAVASFIAAIAFLALLSLPFDFGACINPSRERPYFFQGRLMAGALIPFAVVYVYGLSRILRSTYLVLPAIAAIALVVTISDFLANSVAFASVYNLFHM